MKTKVYYAGKPCIQEVAVAIARASQQNCELLPPSYMPEGITCAFIGSSDKGGKPVKEVMDFISIMDPKRIAHVALYATNPKGDATAVLDSMRATLKARGVHVFDETYSCQGKGTIGGKMPSEDELKAVTTFVETIDKGMQAYTQD